MRSSTFGHSFHQDVDAFGFPSTTGAKGHHTMTDTLGLIELDELEDPGIMVD